MLDAGRHRHDAPRAPRLSRPFVRVRDRSGGSSETASAGASAAAREIGALIEVTRHEEGTRRLVLLEDALRLTGLGRQEVLERRDTQLLVSIDTSGNRTEFVRIPLELLGGEAEAGGHDLPEHEDVLVSLGPAGGVVHLSKKECWELYVLLDDDAPFVRNQLRVMRHGGRGSVALTTRAERRQVLDRLVAGADRASTGGLAALRAAIAEVREDEGPDEVVRV